MLTTTFRSQVLSSCHSRAKRRIPVSLLSVRLFPFLRGKWFRGQVPRAPLALVLNSKALIEAINITAPPTSAILDCGNR
jgi:hypothetical protein